MEMFVGFQTGVGIDGEGTTVATGCSGCGFIWKKAIAINSTAINIRMKPMKTIVRNPPMRSSRAAVENKPTLAFADSTFSDRLAKKAVIMLKIHRTASAKKNASKRGAELLVVMFEVSGVNPVSVDKSPFHVGQIT